MRKTPEGQVHFVGFRNNSEWWSAVKVWGKPHFIHYTHDRRLWEEVADSDVVVFGSKGHAAINVWSYDNSQYSPAAGVNGKSIDELEREC